MNSFFVYSSNYLLHGLNFILLFSRRFFMLEEKQSVSFSMHGKKNVEKQYASLFFLSYYMLVLMGL